MSAIHAISAAAPAMRILRHFIETGQLDPHCSIEIINPEEIGILYLRSTRNHAGTGRAFLRRLKDCGLRVHVRWPTREALPFWRRMHEEQLVEDDPDRLCTWNDFIGPIESQMKAAEDASDAG